MYNYNLRMLIPFKMDYSCCFGLGGNLEFQDFLPKKFYNIDTRSSFSAQRSLVHGHVSFLQWTYDKLNQQSIQTGRDQQAVYLSRFLWLSHTYSHTMQKNKACDADLRFNLSKLVYHVARQTGLTCSSVRISLQEISNKKVF